MRRYSICSGTAAGRARRISVSNQSHKRAATVAMKPGNGKRQVTMQVVAIAVVLLLLVLVAAAWRWTPLNEWLDPRSLISIAEDLREGSYAPLVVVCVYVVSAVVVFPVTLLNTVIVIVFGPVVGGVYALAGAALSAAVAYWIGRRAGRRMVRRIAGERINRLSSRLARRGITAMALVRLVPIAPYTVVNLVAGASHISFRDFMIGSVLGLAPGIAATAIFVDRAAAALKDPGLATIGLFAAVVVLMAAAVIVVRRHLGRASDARRAGASG